MIRPTRRLEDVAEETGRTVEQLRQWCATGLLSCDRLGGEWVLPEAELPAAHALSAVGPRLAAARSSGDSHLLAVAFPDHPAARQALDAIRSRTGVRPSDVELAPLSIDGMPMVLVAGRVPAIHRDQIEAIVAETDGRLIDGALTRRDVEHLDVSFLEGFGA